MKEIDLMMDARYGISGLSSMEQASNSLFLELVKQITYDTQIIVVCGGGNNGGDGFGLAQLLHKNKYKVKIYFVGDEKHISSDCLLNKTECEKQGVSFLHELEPCELIVDAMFGFGLTRPVVGSYAKVIEEINKMDCYVISIDIPSGIDANNGKIKGVAIQANETHTIQTGKFGLYVHQGRQHAGKITTLDIGIKNELIEQYGSDWYLIDKKDMKERLPKRKTQSNKATYGKVLCIGGSISMSGAISLASLAALRVGCGMMTCAIPKSIHTIVATNVLESMQLILPDKDGYLGQEASVIIQNNVENYDCILIGCGIGRSEEIKNIVNMLMQTKKSLLIDADALFVLKDNLYNRKELILTPHLKEFAHLMNIEVRGVVKDMLKYALQFSKQYPNITLVLKSETTLVVQGERVYVNTYGNNGLAKAGSGDVLAGIITGLYAQCKDAFNAAILGVFLHSYSADVLLQKQSIYSIMPSDIIEQVDKTIMEIDDRT